MPKYSEIPAVEEVFARWVNEEDPPAGLYPEGLRLPALKRAIEAIDGDVRVHETVHASFEHAALTLAAKATKLFPGAPGVVYGQVNVHLSSFGRLGLVAWEWRRPGDKEPTRAADPPGASERLAKLTAGVRALLESAGVLLVPFVEAERVVRVIGDPHYEGEFYEIKVFEVLWGMGYPERQR